MTSTRPTRLRIGFRSYATVDQLEIAKRVGCEVIELMWEEAAWKRAEDIRKQVEQFGIGVSAMTMGAERTFEEFKEDIDYAASIGCKVLVGHPHPLKWKNSEQIEVFKGVWLPSLEYGVQKGVRMAIQSCTLNPESWDVMLKTVPGLGLKYDPSFSYQAGRSYRAEILRYGQEIVHVHAKDEMLIGQTTDFTSGILQFKYAPAGMGDIHWGSIIALLYEVGYQGDIAIEPHSEYWWGREGLERGLILAKRHLEQFIA